MSCGVVDKPREKGREKVGRGRREERGRGWRREKAGGRRERRWVPY
jgi:hypothetical protein